MSSTIAQFMTGGPFATGPRSARSAYVATVVVLAAGVVMLFVLIVVSIVMATFAPFIAVAALVAMVGIPQGAAAIALSSRRTWLRVIGIVMALAITIIAGLFLGAVALQAVLMIAGTFKGSFGDIYDTIGVFASLLPAALLLFLDGRAVFFGTRELFEKRSR